MKNLLNFSLINIDKPTGPTSFQISQFVKESLNLKKTSHAGTLDPQTSGVLPIMLGRACKLSNYFMHKDKTYVGIMRLHKDNVTDSELKKAMKKYTGEVIQLPPVRSSVKRAERTREIKKFEVLERKDKDVLFISEVEAGTYIRRLCDDVGKEMGGAHMLELRRTKASVFDETTAITLYEFDEIVKNKQLQKVLVPAEQAIKQVLPTIQISDKNLKQILAGKPLHKQDIKELIKEETFAAFTKEKFIGVYHKTQEGEIVARPEFVYN